MDKIYVILGKSASGKDTIYQKIVSMCNLVPIVYYTTRPIRAGEIDGKDYFYVTEKEIMDAEKQGKLIEKRTYDTIKGLWTYATINDGQFSSSKDGIIVLPPKAYYSFIEYFGKDKVIPIYIHVPDGIRLRRSIERDEKQDIPNYEETCRRFLSDAQDFKDLDVEKQYLNDSVDRCVAEIVSTMKLPLKKQSIINEGVVRLKRFGFFESVIDNYKNGIIGISDTEQRGRTISDDMLPIIEQIEKGYDCNVYHVICTKAKNDCIYHFLTISNDMAEWDEERTISHYFRPVAFSYSVLNKILMKPQSIRLDKDITRVLTVRT